MGGESPIKCTQLTLAEAGTWFSGGTPSTANDSYWGGEIPWISAASLKCFDISSSDRRLTHHGAENGSRLVPEGTIMFIVRGMSLKSEFRIGVTKRTVAFGQDCKAIIPAHGIDPHFLAQAIKARTPKILAMVEETSHGTGRLDTERLQELEIAVPELQEQRRIVAAYAAMERRITSLEKVRAKLRIAEEALIARTFVAEGSHWPMTHLESIASVAAGVTLGSEPVGDGTVELPYLRVANVLDGRIDVTDLKRVRILRSQYERFALHKGDLLLTEGGDLDKLGRGAVWDGHIEQCLHQNHVFRVRCGDEMVPEFLSLYTSSVTGRRYFQSVGKQTTNLASINSTQVKNMPVPVPPLSAQEELLGPVRALRSRIAAVNRQITKLAVVRQGVMQDLLG